MKPSSLYPPTKETRVKVPPSVFDLVLRLMLKRLAAGYTREELDFFLGFNSPYWQRIESFNRYGYLTVADILLLCDLFNCSPTEFKPPRYDRKDSSSLMHIQMKERTEFGQIGYEIYRLGDEDNSTLLYKLVEADPDKYPLGEVIQEAKAATAIIADLFESTFFDEPKDALEIFRECRSRSENIKPRFIHAALQQYLRAENGELEQISGGKYDAMALAYQRIHQKKK